MLYVIGETERRVMMRVTCPVRDVAECAKLPAMTAHRTLDARATKGLWVRESREGQAGSATDERRSTRWPTPTMFRFSVPGPRALYVCPPQWPRRQ
jgi:hypothetical protein